MSRNKTNYSRRDFFKIAGAAGAGTVLASMGKTAAPTEAAESGNAPTKAVPTRPYGRTGVNVSILGFGGSHSLSSKQILLRQAVKTGVTYWDNSHTYERGKSEGAMGAYFAAYPEDRKKIFLVTKSHASDPARLSRNLDGSLERLKTDYVDMYFIHGVSDVSSKITKETMVWVDKAKAAGRIRFFGFSTHQNMANCMLDAARLGGIDGIMTAYNYRIMQTDAMKRAVDACGKVNMGLTAMKTVAPRADRRTTETGRENEIALKLMEQLGKKGYTPEQARLKVVWDNPNITTICSEMPNLTILEANVASALNPSQLSSQDKRLLQQYAQETSTGYCAGCATLCESVVDAPICDTMRYLMYADGYGDYQRAVSHFREIPQGTRKRLTRIDYSAAERICPQKIPIGRLMAKAARTLGLHNMG